MIIAEKEACLLRHECGSVAIDCTSILMTSSTMQATVKFMKSWRHVIVTPGSRVLTCSLSYPWWQRHFSKLKLVTNQCMVGETLVIFPPIPPYVAPSSSWTPILWHRMKDRQWTIDSLRCTLKYLLYTYQILTIYLLAIVFSRIIFIFFFFCCFSVLFPKLFFLVF